MKYRIYIDEVGNPDLGSSENPNHRFLSLTGVILELDYVEKIFHPQMEALKRKYFHTHPDDPVILHRKEMVNAMGPFETLKDRSTRESFNSEMLEFLRKWEYTVLSVCIDKKKHKDTYSKWLYEPYHYCLAVLLERFAFFLKNKKCHGDVMAESRGGKADLKLKESFERLWRQGTEYVEPQRFQDVFTSMQLKVKPKTNNIAGLQLADIIAHPSRNEILKEQGIPNISLAPFAQQIIEIIKEKYYQRDGKIVGLGRKFL
jgi:hypothetical protein